MASSRLEAQELVLEALADDRVDRPERLVHEHHRRVGGEGPGYAYPLALATRELARVAVAVGGGLEPDQRQQLVGAARGRSAGQPSSRGTTATLSPIVRWGNSPTCWITYPIRRRSRSGPPGDVPPVDQDPALVGSISRLTILSWWSCRSRRADQHADLPGGTVSDRSLTAPGPLVPGS